jgi:hypothetical protein
VVTVAFFLLIERPCMDPKWPSKLRRMVRRDGAMLPRP